MTFVVFFDDAELGAWIRERSSVVREKHPSRVVVLDGSKPRTDSDRAPDANADWVELAARGASANELSSALSAHALGEAPIVLAWIASSLGSDERFPALAKRAQTVICSSSVVDASSAPVRDFTSFALAHPDIDVQDLAYLRLLSWQDIVADLFDDAHLLQDLFKLREVEIVAGSEAEGYYMLGWLASRLAWTPCAKNRMCNRENETIDFSVRREGPPRRVGRVTLKTEATEYVAEVVSGDPDVARVESYGYHAQGARFIPLRGLDVASLVGRAVVTHRDPVFHETVAMTKLILDSQT